MTGEQIFCLNHADTYISTRDCVVTVDKDILDSYIKIWIPQYNPDRPHNRIWGYWKGIEDFIRREGLNPRRTIRMSIMSDFSGQKVQVFIPMEMVDDLHATVWCFKPGDLAKMDRSHRPDVDYRSWPHQYDTQYEHESPHAKQKRNRS